MLPTLLHYKANCISQSFHKLFSNGTNMSSVLILDRPLYPTLITKAYSSSEFQKLFCYSSFMFFFSLCLYFILLQWKAICHSKSGYLSLLLPSTLLCNDLLSFSDFQMGGQAVLSRISFLEGFHLEFSCTFTLLWKYLLCAPIFW